ncbi:hypothetical protein EV193_105230 [Herbihabitans rhizosphaerae]|uniref:Uncharacterized protein n=1 Tax=Herbihabitans rhizosphaerae TaxID=1872711 RepID=A0A4Q7KQR6_9PSEU|nr:hypothetical protein [Herbihabitans rhizosphaerae]RZS37672.1 hypothetical protein EV193_105230 [Herbihabitans rhizosphaerae]
MTEPAPRPKRPPALIAALVVLPLAALLFGMTASNLGGPGSQETGLPSVAVLISLLAIRFNWARATSVAVLAFLTIQWLPGAVENVDHETMGQAATYVLIGTALFAAGAVLVYLPPSNQYYRQAAELRSTTTPRPPHGQPRTARGRR